MGIIIEKKYQKTPLGAVVEDSMTSGSTVNAPSINAVQSAFSNPNLLINGDFQVWQRGTSFIEQIGTASQVFCADRWSTFGGIIAEKTENGIKVTGGEELLALNQRLEFKLKSDTTYTLSAKVNGVVYTKTFNGGNYFDESLFVYISWGDEFDANGIYIPTNTTYEIEWIKLEKGSIATPFVPRLYAEELELCKRYYETLINFSTIGTMQWGNIVYFYFTVTEKRIVPTVRFHENGGNFAILLGADTIALTTNHIHFEKAETKRIMWCYINTVTPTDIGLNHIPGYTCNVNANSNAFIEFDAEIY